MSNFDKEESLRKRKKSIVEQIERLKKHLQTRYILSGEKTIHCELFFTNTHTDREFVVATGSSNAMFAELQDIPRGEAAAYKRAFEKANDFISTMVTYWDFARDNGDQHEIPFFGEKYFTMNLETPLEITDDK